MRGGAARRGALAVVLAAAACTVVNLPPAPSPEPRTGPIGVPVPDRTAPADPGGTGAAAPSPAPAGTGRAPLEFPEVRGLWVVRFSMTSPASVRAAVERAAGAGFNTLLVQVRGRGDAFHASALEPRADALSRQPAGFDPLALAVAEAHARGMAVHAWVNTNLVAGATAVPTDPLHIARAHPEALMVPRALARELAALSPYDPRYVERLASWSREHARRVEGLYAAPWSAPVRERVEAVVLDLTERYDLDGIHFDYIRYPAPDFDYSAGALAAFRAWAAPRLEADRRRALDGALERDPLAWADALPELWGAFRREQVTTLLERLHFGIKVRKPWMTVSAAVLPDTAEARRDRLQDWPGWVRAGLLDAVAPMAYTTDDRRFREQIGEVIAAVGPRARVWAGIGTYRTGFGGTIEKIGVARDLGADGLVLFSYDWAVDPAGGGGPAFLDRVGRSAFGR